MEHWAEARRTKLPVALVEALGQMSVDDATGLYSGKGGGAWDQRFVSQVYALVIPILIRMHSQ